jgi:AcrR family transcriptional regulator
VDPALVHHYFGTKQQLFAAVMAVPVNPAVITDALAAAPLDQLGPHLVRVVVGAWDSVLGDAAVAVFRSALAGTNPEMVRSFLLDIALRQVRERVDAPPGSGVTRVALVASQMLGVLVSRRIIGLEPLASMPVDALARIVGPTLQRYLTGELD